MDTGVRTPNLPLTSTADEVLVNHNGSTCRQTVDALNDQLAGSGAIDAAFSDIRATVNTATNAVGARVTTLANDLDNRIDGIDGQIVGLSTAIGAIGSGSAEGMIVDATLSGLTARATAMGLGAGNAGRPGRVYSDAIAANNGDYRWSGTAWTLLGSDRIGKIEAATAGQIDMFRLPLIHDPWGVKSGGTHTIYVPRTVYVRRGSNVLNGTYGTASSAFPNHVALQASATTLGVIYIDLTDATNPIKIANYSTLPPATRSDTIVVIAEVYNYRIKSALPVVRLEDADAEHLSFRWPIMVDDSVGKILLGAVYHYAPDSGFTLYSPATGEAYWEFDLNTSQTSEWRIYFDVVGAAAGAPFLVASSGTTHPLAAGNKSKLLEVARVVNSVVVSEHPILRGAPNMLVAGNDPNNCAPYNAVLTTRVTVTSSDLIALGISRGWGGSRPMPVLQLGANASMAGWVFARIYQQAPADNAFKTPSVYVYGPDGTLLVTYTAVLEKQISARAAIYSRLVRHSGTVPVGAIAIGLTQTGGGADDDVTLANAQISYGGHPATIGRNDFGQGATLDILMPGRLFTVQGRPLPIYRKGVVPDREQSTSLTLSTVSDTGAALPWIQRIGDSAPLDSGAPASVQAQVAGVANLPGFRAYRNLSISSASLPRSGALKVLCIGDSIINREVPFRLKAKLTVMGYTPTMVGTMVNDGGEAGEGRGSWEYADFIGMDTSLPAVPIGGEGAYMALVATNGSNPGRWHNNPFLRPSVAGDDPTNVYSGLIFDFPSYLSRFGVSTPDVVYVQLGTNDINLRSVDQAIAQINAGLAVMIPSILSASSTIRIGIGLPTLPATTNGNGTWRLYMPRAIGAILNYVATLASSRVDVVPTWLHMDPDLGWVYAARSVDGGRNIGYVGDELHPEAPNRNLMCEAIAQWIACRI